MFTIKRPIRFSRFGPWWLLGLSSIALFGPPTAHSQIDFAESADTMSATKVKMRIGFGTMTKLNEENVSDTPASFYEALAQSTEETKDDPR